MLTQQEQSHVNQTVDKIKEILEEVACNPDDYDLMKASVGIYELVLRSLIVCPHCGIDLVVERETFGGDKLFTGHNCRGTYKKKESKDVKTQS